MVATGSDAGGRVSEVEQAGGRTLHTSRGGAMCVDEKEVCALVKGFGRGGIRWGLLLEFCVAFFVFCGHHGLVFSLFETTISYPLFPPFFSSSHDVF